MNKAWVILKKEIIDNLRDRRSVFNALFAVLFNPLLYIALFSFMGRSFSNQADQVLHLPVVGMDNAPNLIDFLSQNGVVILPTPSDFEELLRSGESEVVLVIPDEYEKQIRLGQSAVLELHTDRSNQGASVPLNRVERLLTGYSRQLVALRLLARGISPEIIEAVPVDVIDVAPQEQSTGLLTLNLLPTVMITAAFFGGFYLAVDMTAGERERKSLEPLLINPVPRWLVVLGKFMAAFLFTLFATGLATALFLTMLAWPVIQDFMGTRFDLNLKLAFQAVGLMIPVVFMAVALEVLVAAFSRSVKEAQTYTQLLAIVGFLPTVLLSVLPVKAQTWMVYIPTVSQLFLVQRASRGEPLLLTDVTIASLITVLVGVIALWGTVRLYNREDIFLGGAT